MQSRCANHTISRLSTDFIRLTGKCSYQLAAVCILEYTETHGDQGVCHCLHETAAFITVEVSIAVLHFMTFCDLLGDYQCFGAVCGNGGRKFPDYTSLHYVITDNSTK
jgi:hypothetical protein